MKKNTLISRGMKAVSIVSMLCAITFGLTTYNRYLLPYNAEGKYFDGTVVWQQQAIMIYLILTVVFLVAGGLLFVLSNRLDRDG